MSSSAWPRPPPTRLMNVVTVTLRGHRLDHAGGHVPHRDTMQIVFLGLIAFLFGTGSGVLGAKLMNLFLTTKINPLIGSAGIASVPIAARVPRRREAGGPGQLPDLPRHGTEPGRRVRHRHLGRHHVGTAGYQLSGSHGSAQGRRDRGGNASPACRPAGGRRSGRRASFQGILGLGERPRQAPSQVAWSGRVAGAGRGNRTLV